MPWHWIFDPPNRGTWWNIFSLLSCDRGQPDAIWRLETVGAKNLTHLVRSAPGHFFGRKITPVLPAPRTSQTCSVDSGWTAQYAEVRSLSVGPGFLRGFWAGHQIIFRSRKSESRALGCHHFHHLHFALVAILAPSWNSGWTTFSWKVKSAWSHEFLSQVTCISKSWKINAYFGRLCWIATAGVTGRAYPSLTTVILLYCVIQSSKTELKYMKIR